MKNVAVFKKGCVALFIIYSSFLSCQTKIIPYQQLPSSSGSLTGSGIFFSASMTTSSIIITFEGPSDRWIALGFGTHMNPTDVLIYSNGHAISTHPLGWYDYYNSSYNSSGVLVDGIQNWNVISTNTISSGNRTITASRALNTGDVNDVVFNFTATALNLVWAKGASADYTIAYHGSTNRANGISLPWLSLPTASFATSSTTLCAGNSITYSNTSQGGSTNYSWTFQGGSPAISSSTNPSVTYSVQGIYSVSLIASNSIGSSTLSQINYITVNPTVAPSVSIGLASGSNPMCSGALVSYTSSSTNGGSSPSFQWKINGLNAGTNSPNFTSGSLSTSSNITCVMTSNAQCPNPSSITSVPITMTVSSIAPASVTVTLQSGSNPSCLGSTVVFSANPGNGGTNPFFQWKSNGINVGSNSSTYSTNSLFTNDVVFCELNSNAPCAISTLAISSAITMTVSATLSPFISIIQSLGNNPSCIGNQNTFSATTINGGNPPSYQWKVNGINVGNNGPLYSSSALGNGVIISCEMISGLSCSSPSLALSNAISMTVNPRPTASIMPVGPFCNDSDSFTLQGLPIGGTYSGPGVFGTQFVPSSAGIGSNIIVYEFTDSNNCSDTAATPIVVSDCSSIKPSAKSIKSIITIYPNPSSGIFIFDSENEKIKSMVVFDMSGTIIFKRTYEIETTVTVDLSDELSGLYVAKLFLENNLVWKKIIKK